MRWKCIFICTTWTCGLLVSHMLVVLFASPILNEVSDLAGQVLCFQTIWHKTLKMLTFPYIYGFIILLINIIEDLLRREPIWLTLNLAEGLREGWVEAREMSVAVAGRCLRLISEGPRRIANCSAKCRRSSVRSGPISSSAANVSNVKRSSYT